MARYIYLLIALYLTVAQGFAPQLISTSRTSRNTRLYMAAPAASSLPDVNGMKAGELTKELESYGMSTKTYFEKSELVDAVKTARAEGKKPNVKAENSSASGSSSKSSSSSSSDTSSKEERLKKEMENCQAMKAGELRKELQSYGISTKSFFEKSEFVKACAEARVNGAKNSGGSSSGRQRAKEEPFDPSYRDVVMQKMGQDQTMALLSRSSIIDVRLG
mmetsp:Transcript_13312/g.19394  ORF Transcript_13312/g.19394 Transcript_13312/m.19394 type:complete len:219 (-) Transcript_13312:276-932(-)|eukprot:CAMPEP_0194080070 /NCGR_PEP_ID=MMETSP0149-20130528/6158_1 /TAXON_ID=122233 /ORGANISM="Chaetoceros debilis, Strain MM31A-1" /LENGTH=218 /DNA_ID=CAMNT_0038761705 /DNA_START=140 /DNA_END=796 /DNA_ORIENTATION=-